jgi:signal transduction histidine kinase
MLAADHGSLRLLAWRNFHQDSAAFWERVEVGAGSTCSKALSDNERVVVADIEACEFMAGTADQQEYRRSGIRAVQSTPLRSRSGRPLGMISTHWRTPHRPTEEDFRFFDVLARQAADLIERSLAEAALRESDERFFSTVSQKLIEAHEEERARIARELHDDISQQLALVSVRLDFLRQRPPASAADLNQEIGDLYQQIGNLASDIQALSHDLHPPKLELMGLESAVVGFCKELSNRHGVTIDVHCENIPKALPPEISLCLYRVLQEALQNVVKHSVSRHAHVSLNGQAHTITLTVTDSGAGFDVHEAMRGSGLGLTSMTERLKVLGGQLSIHSERGRGTMIHAVAPRCLPTKPANVVR